MSNAREYIATDSLDIRKVIKQCYEQLYAHKFDLGEIDLFL